MRAQCYAMLRTEGILPPRLVFLLSRRSVYTGEALDSDTCKA